MEKESLGYNYKAAGRYQALKDNGNLPSGSVAPVELRFILWESDVSVNAVWTTEFASSSEKKFITSKTRGESERVLRYTNGGGGDEEPVGMVVGGFMWGNSKISPTNLGANINTRPAGTA